MAPPKFLTPESAKAFASSKLRTARAREKDGQVTDAFGLALEGWQALQPHLEDGGCQELSQELLADLERYGEQEARPGVLVRGKPLKIE